MDATLMSVFIDHVLSEVLLSHVVS